MNNQHSSCNPHRLYILYQEELEDESHKTKDILIKNLYWNGRLLEELNDVKTNEFTENIKYKSHNL